MRIISGVLKGKSVNFLKNSITRPLKDSVKENIFNVLKHSKLINADIENADVLDLYSGVGSFGLECISRGAKKVLFVEQDKMAFKILKENLLKLSVVNKASIINSSVDNIF
jgi:16S rRNA (guanine966-N2)-methyltransferase